MQPQPKWILGGEVGVWIPKGLRPRRLPRGRSCAWAGLGAQARALERREGAVRTELSVLLPSWGTVWSGCA